MTATAWEQTLGQFERELERFEAALAAPESGTFVSSYAPPTNLGPLPTQFADRAHSLSSRYQAAIRHGEAAQAQIRDALARIARAGTPAHYDHGPTASRVEFTA
jgi:hypothetical protein